MRSIFRTRRRTFAIGLALSVGFVAVALYFGRSRLTVEAYNRLRLGMTLAEVEATLGIKPGQYEPPRDRVFLTQESEEAWEMDPSVHLFRETGVYGRAVVVARATGEVIVDELTWADGDHAISVSVRRGRGLVYRAHATATPNYEVWMRRQLLRLGIGR